MESHTRPVRRLRLVMCLLVTSGTGPARPKRRHSLLILWPLGRELGLPWWLRRQRICLQCRRPEFDPWVRKIPLEKDMSTHSSILAWKMPWTKEPGRLQSMVSQRVRHDWATNTFFLPMGSSAWNPKKNGHDVSAYLVNWWIEIL